MIGLGYIGTRTRLSPSDLDGQVRLARLFTRGLGKVQIQQGDQLEAGKMGREPAVIGLQGLGPGHRVHGWRCGQKEGLGKTEIRLNMPL